MGLMTVQDRIGGWTGRQGRDVVIQCQALLQFTHRDFTASPRTSTSRLGGCDTNPVCRVQAELKLLLPFLPLHHYYHLPILFAPSRHQIKRTSNITLRTPSPFLSTQLIS